MMNEIRRLALFHVIACLCSALNGNRAVFEEQPYGDIIFKQDGTMPNLFHKRFHQCSIDKECNYVVHYINTNEYRKIGKQSQLPIHRKGCKIWKKMTVEVQLEGRAKGNVQRAQIFQVFRKVDVRPRSHYSVLLVSVFVASTLPFKMLHFRTKTVRKASVFVRSH